MVAVVDARPNVQARDPCPGRGDGRVDDPEALSHPLPVDHHRIFPLNRLGFGERELHLHPFDIGTASELVPILDCFFKIQGLRLAGFEPDRALVGLGLVEGDSKIRAWAGIKLCPVHSQAGGPDAVVLQFEGADQRSGSDLDPFAQNFYPGGRGGGTLWPGSLGC